MHKPAAAGLAARSDHRRETFSAIASNLVSPILQVQAIIRRIETVDVREAAPAMEAANIVVPDAALKARDIGNASSRWGAALRFLRDARPDQVSGRMVRSALPLVPA